MTRKSPVCSAISVNAISEMIVTAGAKRKRAVAANCGSVTAPVASVSAAPNNPASPWRMRYCPNFGLASARPQVSRSIGILAVANRAPDRSYGESSLYGDISPERKAIPLQCRPMPKRAAKVPGAMGWWAKFPLRSEHLRLNILLLAVPVAVGLHLADAPPIAVFIASGLGIVPLAGVMGEATEALAAHTGPTIGGILNATFGNATELIIAVFALRAGHVEVVKASLSGSIIGNILLVLGLSIVAGGIGREKQTFSRAAAGTNTTMLFIAVIALVMPAVYEVSVLGGLHHEQAPVLMNLSLWTSGVLIAIYAVSFIFVLHTHQRIFCAQDEVIEVKTSRNSAIISLALATIFVGVLSEMLVGEIEAVTKALGWTEFFVGVIVVAIIGNAAEHSTAMMMARRDKMDLAITIAVGSSTQIALFVAPVLVFLSLALGHPMTLVFNAFEIVAIVVSVLIVQMVSDDGESTWFEGAQLLAVYLILAVSFYFVPA